MYFVVQAGNSASPGLCQELGVAPASSCGLALPWLPCGCQVLLWGQDKRPCPQNRRKKQQWIV